MQLDGWFVWFNREYFERVIHINESTSILNRKLQRLPKVPVDTLIAVYRAVEANQKEFGGGKYRFAQVAEKLSLSSARKAQKYYERAHQLILRD